MLFLGTLLIYLVFTVSRFERITDINALDYAQVARHVARGEGFTTSFIKPLSLVYNKSVENHPELTYPPLHIGWTSLVMRVMGPTDKAVSHSSGLAFLLTSPLVFLLALRLFDLRTASLATILYATNGNFLDYAISGLEASLLGLLVTGFLFSLYLAAKAGRREMLFVAAAGALMGLIYLTKDVWVLAAIPALVYLVKMREERRLARAGVFVGLAVLVALPWLVRNYNLTGNPFFTLRATELLGQTRAYPGNSLYRRYAEYIPNFVVFAASNPRAVFDKCRSGLALFYPRVAGMAGIFLTPFFLVAILTRLGDEDFERWRNSIYAMLVIVALALTLLIAAPRLLAPLGPAMTVIATAYFWRLVNERTAHHKHERKKSRAITIAVAVLVAAHVFPFVLAVTPGPRAAEATPDAVNAACEQLAERTEGAVLTDMPWAVAWVADRDAVWLPQAQLDLNKLESAVGPFRWMLLTPLLPQLAAAEDLQQWADVWRAAQRGDIKHGRFGVRGRLADSTWILFERLPSSQ